MNKDNEVVGIESVLDIANDKIDIIKRQNERKEKLINDFLTICSKNKIIQNDVEYAPIIFTSDKDTISVGFTCNEKDVSTCNENLLQVLDMSLEDNTNISDIDARSMSFNLFVHTLLCVIIPNFHKSTVKKIDSYVIRYKIPTVSIVDLSQASNVFDYNAFTALGYAGQPSPQFPQYGFGLNLNWPYTSIK